MKKYRTQSDWLALIEEFEQSGLTQAKFCAERGLNAKYFSLRRTKLKARPEPSGFSRAVLAEPKPSGEVTVHYGSVMVKLPGGDARTIAQLVKALAV
ncbi:IS66 family insertion sequence element accessory protein TnpB [Gilvimarinus agarilyticus]|uniref:IS66 family insertion sequence element accessory protein TnpA n=1 Tax=Gilvimarinus sp. 2_MG-2023 TaxID=3062666 RepID=UPI001C08A27E|nr:IS66 family insertion sequence element accessory protein TnpB [Gilvimarinus sp. 2_MG-2023]MBU2885503.1 IS66 family insertion sequence element accessory protein TnpB [Gilvimarinus agarilyticus]MDO6570403.1 IS66 family insertion sequence element accessory protein TnpB [Gilvimarinus sp. 2_MG-2023]